MAVTGLYGGAFDPPHVGHVALAAAAKETFDIPRLTVLVAASPGHKRTQLAAETRLELARIAFPDDDVRLDPYPRTIELLRAEQFESPLFIVGSDEFCDFPQWVEPDGILELAELAVGTRPGFSRRQVEAVLDRIERPERVRFFDLTPHPAASSAIRVSGSLEHVPTAVAEVIRERGLYGAGAPRGYTESA